MGPSNSTKWDKILSEVIRKHWLNAKENDAFTNYPLDIEFCKKDILFGLLERWLRGQKDNYMKPRTRNKKPRSRVKHRVSLRFLSIF